MAPDALRQGEKVEGGEPTFQARSLYESIDDGELQRVVLDKFGWRLCKTAAIV